MENCLFQYPVFYPKPVPVRVAASVLGMNENTVREKMEKGVLNIGIVSREPLHNTKAGKRQCYISPKKFWELTGYIWNKDEYEKYTISDGRANLTGHQLR